MSVRIKGELVKLLATGAGQTVERQSETEAVVHVDQRTVEATSDEQVAALKQETLPPAVQALEKAFRNQALPPGRLERASALVEFVRREIQYDSKAQLVDLETAVERRRGVCRHFAELYTALARSCGIPARTIHGLATGGDQHFGPHAWVQIVCDDGKWRSIDPTFGMMSAPSHIHFEGAGFLFEIQNAGIDVIDVAYHYSRSWVVAIIAMVGTGFVIWWRRR